jgi:hypothetical protein
MKTYLVSEELLLEVLTDLRSLDSILAGEYSAGPCDSRPLVEALLAKEPSAPAAWEAIKNNTSRFTNLEAASKELASYGWEITPLYRKDAP